MTQKTTTPKQTDKTKVLEVQIELDLTSPTSTSKAGASIWRGECTTQDGYRLFFQVYSPSPQKAKTTGLKVVAK